MHYRKKRSLPLHNIAIIFILLTLITGCGPDKKIVDKVSFPPVQFTIAATKDTTIFGEQGTRLFIEKGSFQFTDGTPATDSIQIELKEFYTKKDIVLADLCTVSNNQLLETAGMLHIAATAKGKPLEIKSDKRIVVHFPKLKEEYKAMNLFFADSSATDSNVANWNVDTIDLVKTTVKLGSWGYHHLSATDSTPFDFIPKRNLNTEYNWSPLELYVNKFDFSKSAIEEINTTTNNYDEIEFDVDESGKIKNPVVNAKLSKNTVAELLSFVNGLPEFTPGKDKNGNIVLRRATLSISKGEQIPLFKTREEYLSSFDKKYARFEKSPVKNMNDAELEYYIFSVAKLGWINCDRFLKSDATTDFMVLQPVDKDIKIKMVFKDIAGVLMATTNNGRYVFSRVPVGKAATIIAIKNTNGQLRTAFKDIIIADKPLDKLNFTVSTLSELKKQLEKLN